MLAESTAGRIASQERYCHFVTADGLYVFTDGIEPLLEPSAFGQTSLRASHENESGLFSGDHLAVTKWANLAPGHDRRCVSVTLPIHDRVGETSSSSRSNRDEKSALLECADLLHMLLRHTAPVVEPAESDLAAAVRDLGEVITEATESGFRVPSRMALSNAEQLLHAMHKVTPRRFEVYPTPDGGVAIDAPSGRGSSVLMLCDSAGGVICLVNLRGRQVSRTYSSTDKLPDTFVREALFELELEGN